MIKIRSVFDGNAFFPKEPVLLTPNTEYIILISEENKEPVENKEIHPLTAISQLACNMGPSDLSENFDYYTRQIKNND
ncbi:MAG: hypothetical protein BWY64_02935 [bacterium ADurb.Bin363]|nr:MAG: hypothetical protein BWY64_02935 [bacterium ADurb.Bin363]